MQYNKRRRHNHWNNATIFEHEQLNIKNASFFSIKSDEEWARTIENDIKKMPLENFASIIHAPIAKVSKSILHSVFYKSFKTFYLFKFLHFKFN
ncbi:hypothetical protein [Xanthomarina gelatinilytica]|uniref:hypothetical protein n=1 Tax=Xanthomarina gelatinilytica TaxID=1137281 RepID=UPI003AA8212B